MVVIKALRDQMEAASVNKPFEKFCQDESIEFKEQLKGTYHFFFSLVKVIREGWYANRNNPII